MSMDGHDTAQGQLSQAVNDFYAARRKATVESILAMINRRQTNLISYDQVRKNFRTIESARRTLEDIPIDKIVGTVGRYNDFSRSLLPRNVSDAQRWAQVRIGMTGQMGLPPIETYLVGDVYFILDGHHRVSVARELGAKSIEGYVIPVYTRVPLSPGDSPDDLIIKAEYDDFLGRTHLDDLRPGANLLVTVPGQYQKLLEHIAVHQYFMGEKRGGAISSAEAVTDWYDTVYLPIAMLIRERNLLRDFPQRNETDMYLWILDHAVSLAGGGLGWEVRPEVAASDLVARFSPKPVRVLARLVRKITDRIVPDTFEAGPPPGQWRSEHAAPHRNDHLFDDLLVTVSGDESGWQAVRMAVEVARREDARLTGLHVVRNDAEKESPAVQALREEFSRRCAEAGVASRLLIETGTIANLVCQRSPWMDLVVFRMSYPPPNRPLQRLRSGARLLIRRCSAPIFAVPDAPFHLNSALLSYGPGRKADEALYVAAYMAGRWNIPLTVLTVSKPPQAGDQAPSPIRRAREYLEAQGVTAAYIEVDGGSTRDPARAALLAAETNNCDFLIMGGYESGPFREALFGSTVDRVLRSTRRPVLICR